MKTSKKQVQQIGNLSLIQFEILEGKGLAFLPAAPAMEQGELVVKELRQEGAVNTLLAINQTDNYYLLTDMDLLKGAKQNRVVNRSVLIAPRSKQEIEVSCVERSRWSYDSPTFKPGPEVMDIKMRAAKANSLRMEMEEDMDIHPSGRPPESTQSKIWGLIQDEMLAHNVINETEDYTSVLDHRKEHFHNMQQFSHEKGANGLAVFDGRDLISFDIFGNREVYQYYFGKLAGNALAGVKNLEKIKLPGEAEVCYRLDEFLDHFEMNLKDEVKDANSGIGSLRWSGISEYPGFELGFEGQLVHMAGFSQ
jgi:hypothetical protein